MRACVRVRAGACGCAGGRAGGRAVVRACVRALVSVCVRDWFGLAWLGLDCFGFVCLLACLVAYASSRRYVETPHGNQAQL